MSPTWSAISPIVHPVSPADSPFEPASIDPLREPMSSRAAVGGVGQSDRSRRGRNPRLFVWIDDDICLNADKGKGAMFDRIADTSKDCQAWMCSTAARRR